LFAIAQFYIRMGLQDLVGTGRAAPYRTDSQKGWRTPTYKIAVPRQTFSRFKTLPKLGWRDHIALELSSDRYR